MSPREVLAAIARARVVAVLRAPTAEAAVAAVDALVRGGVRAIEITYSTPDVAGVLRTLAERHGDGIVLGAGTVRTRRRRGTRSTRARRSWCRPASTTTWRRRWPRPEP